MQNHSENWFKAFGQGRKPYHMSDKNTNQKAIGWDLVIEFDDGTKSSFHEKLDYQDSKYLANVIDITMTESGI